MADLSFCFQEKREKGQKILSHTHRCHEMVFYGRGASGILRLDGRDIPFYEGTAALIAEGQIHEERHDAECEVICLGFWETGDLKAGVWQDMRRIKPLFDTVIQEMRIQDDQYETLVSLKLAELLLYLRRKEAAHRPQMRDLRYSRNYIRENYMQKVSVKALAETVGYSGDHFRHLYAEKFGLSPQNDLIQTRIEHAVALLKNSRKSCLDIAFECGFSDSGQMTKMLKKYCGQTPKNLRREE